LTRRELQLELACALLPSCPRLDIHLILTCLRPHYFRVNELVNERDGVLIFARVCVVKRVTHTSCVVKRVIHKRHTLPVMLFTHASVSYDALYTRFL
jgi:hypothetical protein